MILFYSDYCPHCRMLIETIKSYDKENKIIKLVSIDVLRSKGQNVPIQIKSVPSLITMPEKQILFGKEVFDYLLLPGSGKLLNIQTIVNKNKELSQNENNSSSDDLISFSFGAKGGYSDGYSLIEDGNDNGFKENNYLWASISDDDSAQISINNMTLPIQEETRKQKDLLDIDKLRIQREMDLKQNDLNKIELPIAKSTRE